MFVEDTIHFEYRYKCDSTSDKANKKTTNLLNKNTVSWRCNYQPIKQCSSDYPDSNCQNN